MIVPAKINIKMNNLLNEFDALKISAFSKLRVLEGDIHNVTIGPNSRISKKQQQELKPRPSIKSPIKTRESHCENTLPFHDVLKGLEAERITKVEAAVTERCNKFNEFSKAQRQQNENQWLMQQQILIQELNQRENLILQSALLKKNAIQEDKLIKEYQERIQRQMQYKQQMEKAREKQKLLKECIDKILKCQLEYRMVYQEIIALLKTCTSEEFKEVHDANANLLKTFSKHIEDILAKTKTGSVDAEDVTKAVNTVLHLKDLKSIMENTIEKINAAKVVEEIKPPPVVAPIIIAPQEVNPQKTDLPSYVNLDNLKKYITIKVFLGKNSDSFGNLLVEEQFKQFRFDCKKAINIPVNALSAVNAEHLRDKYVKLFSLLAGKNVLVADKQINASAHPQGIPFCMDLLARKFVLQGDLMISSNPEAAYCYATIIISLWNEFPDFGRLMLSCFYIQCPFLIPINLPKMDQQSDEEYYKSLGYQYIDGQIEKQDKFLKRMTGIFRLYFAILIAKPKSGQLKNPHNIRNAWTFLASILKLQPQLDITATALHVCLETIGYELEATYGSAFKIIVRMIEERFLPELKKIDTGGPVSRLELILQEYKRKGRFERPNGLLPPNFW